MTPILVKFCDWIFPKIIPNFPPLHGLHNIITSNDTYRYTAQEIPVHSDISM